MFGTKVHPSLLDLMFRVIRSIHDYKIALMSPIAQSLNTDFAGLKDIEQKAWWFELLISKGPIKPEKL